MSAPTGFGKTTALAAWAAASPARFGWVSLDAGDNGPTRFWSCAVAAIESAAPEIAGTAGRRLRAPGVSVADEVLPVVVNQLAAVTQPLVLVLDDYHVVTDEAVHGGVGYLLDRLGVDVHLVLAGQFDPPLLLGMLRARGELNEVRVQQLRFTDEEAAALLNGVHGLNLAPEQLAAVQQRTEGWVAGLNLVALSLRDAGDRDDVMARMPVGDRVLVDYLWEEVAIHQSPATRQFLMRTSVLERLSSAAVRRRDRARGQRRAARRARAQQPVRRAAGQPRGAGTATTTCSAPCCCASSSATPRRASSTCTGARAPGSPTATSSAVRSSTRSWPATCTSRPTRCNATGSTSTTAARRTERSRWIDRLPRATLAEYPELALARAGDGAGDGTAR